MLRVRTGVMLIALGGTATALAQPADPYGPAPAPAPPQPAPPPAPPQPAPAGKDPVLAEQIAEQLVSRAQELFDAKLYVDAKQLAVEALVENSQGNAAERARFLIKQVNQQLGIKDDAPPAAPVPPPEVDARPIEDPTAHQTPVEPPHAELPPGKDDARLYSIGYGAFYGGVVGAAVGSYFSSDHPAAGAVPMGIALAAGAALVAPRLQRKWDADEAQVRTAGSGAFWAGTIGGFMGYTIQGANGGTVTASGVLTGAAIGATAGLLGGASYANQHKFTRGDVALTDTFAGMGVAGGLTLGMLMQPAQKQAYTLNAALGGAAGLVVGMIAGPNTNTTPRRMVRVAGLSAAGGAVPLLLLAAGPHSSGLQRAAGGLSTLGLVAGAWVGFYLTRHMDEGLDVPDKHVDTGDLPVNPPPPPPATTGGTGPTAFVMPIAAGRF